MPSQYPISGRYRPASETPFGWCFACGPIVARFYDVLTGYSQAKAPVTLSRFKPRFSTTHPDLRQMVKSGCIGMRRDGKKEIPASIRCLTMLLRCLHDSSTDPLRLMTAALRFTTVELRMLMMPPRFDTVLVRFKPVALR